MRPVVYKGRHFWTADDIKTAAAIYADVIAVHGRVPGVDARADRLIAERLGLDTATVQNRRRNYGPTFDRETAAGPVPRAAPARTGYGALADRAAREAAMDRRTLTQRIFGDPPPGYSALDRRGR